MRPVRVQYRVFKRNDQQVKCASLSSLIRASLDHKVEGTARRDRTAYRQFDRGQAGAVLLNRCDEFPNWVFGELAIFNPGKSVEIIEDAVNAKVLNLASMKLGQGKHPIQGIVYWIAVEDHVLAIQAPNISLSVLREHLTWLICKATATAPEDISLNPMIEIDDQNAPPVKDIVLRRSGDIGDWHRGDDRSEEEEYVQSDDVGSGRSSRLDQVLGMMRAAGISEANIERLAGKVGDDSELVAELVIKLKRKGRRQKLRKLDALDLIGDLEQDEYKLRGEQGTYRGKATRLTYDEGRVEEKGPFLVPDDARRVLIEAYTSFRANGRIEGSDLAT